MAALVRGNRWEIDLNNSVFVIAEAGVNHNGSMDLAKQLVDAAIEAHADAVKFQSFSAKRLVRENTELVPYQRGSAKDHFELLKELELSEAQQRELADYSRLRGIKFLSTPYSQQDAELLVALGMDIIKVASADIVDLRLHRFLCDKKVTVLASTGMAEMSEVTRLAALYESYGNLENLWLMQCVSNYPSAINSQNLRVLESYKKLVGNRIGFSDHTGSPVPALVAVGAGATVFEKHLTLDRTMKGPDHAASLEPNDFSEYVRNLRLAFESLGSELKQPQPEELEMRRISRKGLYFRRRVSAGQNIGWEDLDLLRPAQGVDAWATLLALPRVAESNFEEGELFGRGDHE
jgi:N,N'-diacetyllegionaminate synthase